MLRASSRVNGQVGDVAIFVVAEMANSVAIVEAILVRGADIDTFVSGVE